MSERLLDELIQLSRRLGEPDRDYVILGEGNTSAGAGDGTYWVKASGTELQTADAASFVRVRARPVLAMLDAGDLDDAAIDAGLLAARVDPRADARPSVETFMHAVCLALEGVRFVGHTHPTAINMIACSRAFEEVLAGRLFPDEIVLCGPAPVLVPYVDPGLQLARELRRRIDAHLTTYGAPPRTIYLQNHGFVALGRSPIEVEHTTAMAVKAARILLGTQALGGPHHLPSEHTARIDTRPDERDRRRRMG